MYDPFWLRMHPYTYLCLSIHLPACPSELALSKDNINAHPLRPLSYWFIQTWTTLWFHSISFTVECTSLWIIWHFTKCCGIRRGGGLQTKKGMILSPNLSKVSQIMLFCHESFVLLCSINYDWGLYYFIIIILYFKHL